MKLGLVSAILGDLGYEEMIDFVSQCGLQCVEVACWPQGKAERRYAGVSHIDVDGLTEERAKYLVQYAKDRNVTISSLAYYPNMLDPNLEKRQVYIDHFLKVIRAADMMHIGTVASFIGRLPDKSVEDNLPEVERSGSQSCAQRRNTTSGSRLKTAQCCLPTTNGRADKT